jgi:hypothetical protein
MNKDVDVSFMSAWLKRKPMIALYLFTYTSHYLTVSDCEQIESRYKTVTAGNWSDA